MTEHQQNWLIATLYTACIGITVFAAVAGLVDW